MNDANAGDTIRLSSGYSDESTTLTVQNLFVAGDASSAHIDLTLGAGIGDVTLRGLAVIDVNDNAGGNIITGNGGANTILVTGGADVVHGGGGIDRLIVDYRAVSATITGTVTGVTDGGTHSVTFDRVENFTILTGSGNDTITVADGDDVITTGLGNDTITAGNGHNRIASGAGNDTVTGGDGGNVIRGVGGDDTITAGAAHDTVWGGAGNDIINTGSGNDFLDGGSGNDQLGGGVGIDTASYEDALVSVQVDLRLTGAQGTGGAGIDTLTGIENLIGSDHNDTLIGNGVANTIVGGLGGDHLNGLGGDDILRGGGGADVLVGGMGRDTLTGGMGADSFVFQTIDSSSAASPDRITDFSDGDRINLHGIDADTATAGDQDFHVGGGGGHAGDLVVSFDAANHRTVIDLYVDNGATIDSTIFLTGHHALGAGDFVL